MPKLARECGKITKQPFFRSGVWPLGCTICSQNRFFFLWCRLRPACTVACLKSAPVLAEKSGKLVEVICGGDIRPNTVVTEQHLLDLEREAFMSLLGMEKTQARIEYTLANGKPLRN